MPTYDYVCRKCGHAFEHFQSMTDALLRTCPECKKRGLERLIGMGAGVVFKGGGFYETDYRSDSYKKAADADKDGGKSSDTDKKASKSDKGDAGTDKSTPAKAPKKKPK